MPAREVAAQAPLDLAAVSENLQGRRLRGPFHYYPQIDSTNTFARARAESGAAEGEVVVAEAQTLGRGRLSRRWDSPPYVNLYFSIVLRPRLAPRHAPQITLTAAVALAEAVTFLLGQSPEIKWPNDILMRGRKLAGILTEAACDAEHVQYVILGIGLNVNYRHEAMPEELRDRATSLAEIAARDFPREAVLARLIHDLDRCYGVLEESGFDALRPQWEAFFGLRDRTVRVEHGGRLIVGRALGIDGEGGLIVQGADDRRYTIIAGDVIAAES